MASSSLPIVQDQPAADLLRLFQHTSLHWAQQLDEGEQLDAGLAICNPDLPDLPEGNQVIEAALPDGLDAAAAVRQAEAHFAAKQRQCRQWSINVAALPRQIEPLTRLLRQRGLVEMATEILRLNRAEDIGPMQAAGFAIIPARASYRHVRELAKVEWTHLGEVAARQKAEEAVQRLDDPHWDSLIALRDGAAAARVGVLSVGDLGRLDGPWVAPAFRGKGIGRVMLARAIDVCVRSTFRHVFAEVPPDCPLTPLLRRAGFVAVGRVVKFGFQSDGTENVKTENVKT